MVNKKLLEIGDRLGMKYPQIEMLNNEFRRDFRFLIFMLFMAGVLFYMNVVGQKAPQVLSMADLGYTEEVVESKQVNTDGRNDQRYRLSLNGWDDGAKIRIHINLEIIDFAEENDPIAGFARESGLPCSAKSCSLAAVSYTHLFYDAQDRPFELAFNYYRTDRCKLSMVRTLNED